MGIVTQGTRILGPCSSIIDFHLMTFIFAYVQVTYLMILWLHDITPLSSPSQYLEHQLRLQIRTPPSWKLAITSECFGFDFVVDT